MIMIGWMMRGIIMALKLDECRACHVVGPHVVLRKTHWFTVFRIPVALLWVSHGLLCVQCGDYEGISFLKAIRALRRRSLLMGRSRPAFEAAVREHVGAAAAEDWAAFGLPAGSSREAVRARWREVAKQLHPDAGGSTVEFARMSAVYQRLLSAREVTVAPSLAEQDAYLAELVPSPHRGFMDAYTKAWPVLAAILLVVGAASDHPSTYNGSSTGGFGSTTSYGATAPGGTAHRCWASGGELIGCQDDQTSVMLFGTTSGTPLVCWFAEPLQPGESASCR